jgi:hypothetical protein
MTQALIARDSTQPEILRVFQTKVETKAFYDTISRVYDLLAVTVHGSGSLFFHVRHIVWGRS